MESQELIVLGRLGKPHGIKGEIRVDYDADSPLLLENFLFLRAGSGRPEPARIASHRLWKDQVIIRLEGVDDRSAAEMMRGQELLIRAVDLPDAEPDEPYLRDILGLPVFLTNSDEMIGVLEDVYFPAGQEIWSIRASARIAENNAHDENSTGKAVDVEGQEILFPAVPEFVTNIDLDTGAIHIAPPPGLLDIYRSEPLKASPPKKKHKV